MSKDPKEPPVPAAPLFPYDEMSTGETSSLRRRAEQVAGNPDRAPSTSDPALKPMTGAQLAFRPSAPTGKTGSQPAFKPSAPTGKTGAQPAFKPTAPTGKTGGFPAFNPSVPPAPSKSGLFKGVVPRRDDSAAVTGSYRGPPPGTQDSSQARTGEFKPFAPGASTGEHAPLPPREGDGAGAGDEAPVFDAEKLQAQFRAMSLTDSAHGHTRKVRPAPQTGTTAGEDTFVKRKMKQAESNMPDFDLDEDLG